MPENFSVRRRVEFCETDAAGIAHFASFLCYMEQAEHAFLRHLGTSVVQKLASQPGETEVDGHLSWPRVHVECDYRGAARFEDELRIDVLVLQIGEKSLTYGFEFTLHEAPIASGKIVAVCCQVRPGALKSTSIPQDLRSKLETYMRERESS